MGLTNVVFQGDAHRPRLYLGISHHQSDYINAIYLNVRNQQYYTSM